MNGSHFGPEKKLTTLTQAPSRPRGNVSFLRHAGWVGPEDLRDEITIIGCGAVGSNLALAAAKMGFTHFSLWDADVVEEHNLPNQAFDLQHVGTPKTDALADVLTRFNPDIQVRTHTEFFTSDKRGEVQGPLVLATDTMKSRKDIYDAFKDNIDIDFVFEIRLGFDYGELNIVDNHDEKSCVNWYNTLRDDSEIPEGPCNQRICTTLVNIVSNYAVHSVCAKYAAERTNDDWSYNSKTMFELKPVLKVYEFK